MMRVWRATIRDYWAAAWLGVVLVLSGCVSEPVAPAAEEELARVSAVSVAQSGFAISPGETVGWRTEILWIGDDNLSQYREALTQLDLQREVENQLRALGLRFVDPAKAEYMLVAAVVIGDSADGAALAELARLYPSLGTVSQTLEKGTLMLGLGHPGSPVVLWRAAVQTYLTADIPREVRAARLESVVRSLVSTLPTQSTATPE